MRRTLYLGELVAIAAMVLLGAVWPTAFTLLALVVLPALAIAVAALIRPALLAARTGLRRYLHASAIVCLLVIAYAAATYVADHSQPVDIVVSTEVTGVVRVVFNVSDATPPTVQAGRRVYEIPATGVLVTQFGPNDGWWQEGERRFFARDRAGGLREVTGRVLSRGVAEVGTCRADYKEYFVEAESAAASRPWNAGEHTSAWGVRCIDGRLTQQ